MINAALSLLTTGQTWDDLILTKKAMEQVKLINRWLTGLLPVKKNRGLAAKIINRSPVLFYGRPGNEKITTATLIGKDTNRPVYNVDIAKLVSKYIGETEKNLDELFDAAEKKDWILFFDEADALFGKRTDVKDSHDRYANLDIAYLMHRIENYPGLVLLSSNKKSNIDDAFTRRLQTIIHFPVKKKID